MKDRNLTENYIFRCFDCGLSVEEVAELCFTSCREVIAWDDGKSMPPQYRRLMMLASKKRISHLECWEDFIIEKEKLRIPSGQLITPQQIVTGQALIELQSGNEQRILLKLLQYSRILSKIKNCR